MTRVYLFGDRFAACRKGQGTTLAETAYALGISQAQLTNIENDRARPGLETLVLAADVFGVSVDYLLGRRA
jgi:transcriptional regulator with XRE-family HTH domain